MQEQRDTCYPCCRRKRHRPLCRRHSSPRWRQSADTPTPGVDGHTGRWRDEARDDEEVEPEEGSGRPARIGAKLPLDSWLHQRTDPRLGYTGLANVYEAVSNVEMAFGP